MRLTTWYTVTKRDYEEWRRREIRRERRREIIGAILAGLAWLVSCAGIIWVCCAASGYHWE